ncbi:MAG: cupredoxin domain-containing protein [Anaerolineales bacterium]
MTYSLRIRRQEARKRQQTKRTVTFTAITIAVLGLAGYLLFSAFFKPGPPPMAGNVIDVEAAMDGFSLYEIRVKVGEPITIRLTSLDNTHHTDGGGKHEFAVEELGIDIVAPAMGSSFATFTPQAAGTYTFYCDICCGGRANPSMNGTLIVEG